MVGFRSFPVFMPPDNSPSLKLGKKEQAEMAALNAKMGELSAKKLDLIRDSARRQGLIADKLQDLKSESGNPFIEEKPRSKGFGGEGYRIAVVKGKFGNAEEAAYLCEEMYSFGKDSSGCGWVRGNPRTENYDDIGVLSGSAGVNYYCKICGRLIGRDVHVRS
jgi:hypothetical protein